MPDAVSKFHHKSVSNENSTKLLILSLDGFHYQYLYRFQNELSFLNSIARQGVLAQRGMTSTFPTMTLPCHYSMATGLYHESHGIVSNYFYDPYMHDTFSMGSSNMNEEKWYSGDPLWSVAVKQEKKLGVIAWFASQVDYKHFNRKNPSKVIGYDAKHKLQDKLMTSYDWMFGNDSLDGVMVYHNNPDKVSHLFGAGSNEVVENLIQIDSDLKSFFKRLDDNKKRHLINIVIVSDHGMTNITQPHLFISDYLDLNLYSNFVDGGGSLLKIFPRNLSAESELVDKLTKIANETSAFILYRRDDMPDKWHYKNNARVGHLIIVSNEGQQVFNNRLWFSKSIAQHGFDNNLDSMKPLFVATGPAFKSKTVIKASFDQINVFSLFCYLLNVTPPTNNGSLTPFLLHLSDHRDHEWRHHGWHNNKWNEGNQESRYFDWKHHSKGTVTAVFSQVVILFTTCLVLVAQFWITT